MVLVLACGLGIGAINGFFVTVVGVNALITTLGMLAGLRGLARGGRRRADVIVEDFSSSARRGPSGTSRCRCSSWSRSSSVFWVLMRYTVFGRSMYAIGANPVAARLAGIRSKRLIFIAFLLSGLCLALGGLILTSQLGSASPVAALGLELSVVTAVDPRRREPHGRPRDDPRHVLGLLIIGVLNNGLVLLNVDPFLQEVAQGMLLIAAVSFDQLRIRLTSG